MVKRLLLGSSETRLVPGATRSGFEMPLSVTPKAEYEATVSSARPAVPWSLVAPTVMTKGSLAGGKRLRLPLLPADTTTTMPWNHSTSHAASKGLVLDDCAVVELSERLTTRMLYRTLF